MHSLNTNMGEIGVNVLIKVFLIIPMLDLEPRAISFFIVQKIVICMKQCEMGMRVIKTCLEGFVVTMNKRPCAQVVQSLADMPRDLTYC